VRPENLLCSENFKWGKRNNFYVQSIYMAKMIFPIKAWTVNIKKTEFLLFLATFFCIKFELLF